MDRYEPTKAFKPNEPGIYLGLSMEDYRKAPGVSGSDLITLKQSPAAYIRNEPRVETEAMKFGTLVNDMLLFNTHNYGVIPETYLAPASAKADAPLISKEWNWGANYCKAWREEYKDKPLLHKKGKHGVDWLKAIYGKVMADKLACELIASSMHEVSVFARHPDLPILMKGRFDGLILNKDGGAKIVEIKTTITASTYNFSQVIMKMGYHRKAAYYRTLLHELGISPVEFWFIPIEKDDHPRVNVRKLEERAMDKGDFDNDDALTLLQNCKLTNFWPDFPDEPTPGSTPQTPMIDIPDYCYTVKTDDLVGMTEVEDDESDK